ncbi:hypothetical protein [Mucilaginibacter gotjawali]|uniref:Uncharacterized protein n=1 Tax=Mucilaginibacter gotjawali TaxID=1550579 RepID=A0A839SIR7_9SPHI|nr:hypothetical protein [Mucilaginibacter gotjawali]MBB3057193.1 hypothetical protein [Mucilaginibacter gotjawali]
MARLARLARWAAPIAGSLRPFRAIGDKDVSFYSPEQPSKGAKR